jgi:hypothetical protein
VPAKTWQFESLWHCSPVWYEPWWCLVISSDLPLPEAEEPEAVSETEQPSAVIHRQRIEPEQTYETLTGHSRKTYRCDLCVNKVFKKLSHLKQHYRSHTGTVYFKNFMLPRSKILHSILFLSCPSFCHPPRTLTLAIVFEYYVLGLWYFTWVFPYDMTFPTFHEYQKIWPCDCGLGCLTLSFDILTMAISFEWCILRFWYFI